MPVTAELSLAAPHAAPLGRERVRLLEAVGREGSISAAARAMGVSYKTAWDAICAMNNLVGRPLVAGQSGGRRGGGAVLTAEGVRLIESFHRLEGKMARMFRALEPDLTGAGGAAARLLLGGFLRTSARNALRGTVTAVFERGVDAEVRLEISEDCTLSALVTRHSLRELGLFPGRPATALIKAPFVMLAPAGDAPRNGDVPRNSEGNRLEGRVAHVETGPINTEITLDIGRGKTLCAIIDRQSAEDLAFVPDTPACARIDAGHIILAVE